MNDHNQPSTENSRKRWLLSANHLLTGRVVYLTPHSQWSTNINDGLQFEKEQYASELLNNVAADQTTVLSPLVMEASLNLDGTLWLHHFRDRFRQSGPTHRSYQPSQGWPINSN